MIAGANQTEWADLIRKIRGDHSTGFEELNHHFGRGARLILSRLLGCEQAEYLAHKTLSSVAEAVRSGAIGDPGSLPAYIRAAIHREVEGHKIRTGLAGAGQMPANDAEAEKAQIQADIVQSLAAGMTPAEQEALFRFYVNEEPAEQICSEVGLTPAEFLELKARAKSQFRKLSAPVSSRCQ